MESSKTLRYELFWMGEMNLMQGMSFVLLIYGFIRGHGVQHCKCQVENYVIMQMLDVNVP